MQLSSDGGAQVARAGFEPATFHFSGERCYQLSYLAMVASEHECSATGGTRTIPEGTFCCRFRDPDGTRTRDLRRDRAAR
jgi:hypothetical protein